MFDLVDAGLTTFEVGGPFFPYTNLRALFGADNTASFYESSEKVLGAFKKRWVLFEIIIEIMKWST